MCEYLKYLVNTCYNLFKIKRNDYMKKEIIKRILAVLLIAFITICLLYPNEIARLLERIY